MNTGLRNQRYSIDALGVVACLLVIALFYVLGLGSLLHQNSDAVAQRGRLAIQRQKAGAALGSVRQLKDQTAALRASAATDGLQSNAVIHINARLQDITSLAAARGLSIKGVEPGVIRQESRYQAMPLRLTGTGSYRGCVQFLHDLRQALHDTTVVDFRLTGTPDTTGSPVTFDLNLCWYAAPAIASAGGS